MRGLHWGGGPDTVLLLHEPGVDVDAWGALPGQLSKALGFNAVALDLPGHGLSDDPWEPAKLCEIVRVLIREPVTSPLHTLTHLPPPPIATGEGDVSARIRAEGRRFVVAAGSVATAALALAADHQLAGLVVLSPTIFPELKPEAHEPIPPPPVAMREGGRGVRTVTPKLFIAGSLADDDLKTARRLAASSGGWTIVTSVPTSERGTGLLVTAWRTRLVEVIAAFLRDCQRPRTGCRPGPQTAPRPPG